MQKLLKSNYLKSKKGMSLIELLCAVLIIAIVVGATATGLAIANQSITMGAEKDKASSVAQKYCDIIMAYFEDVSESDLLANSSDICPLKSTILDDIKADTVPGVIQVDNQVAADSKTKNTDDVYFTVEKEGSYNATTPAGGTVTRNAYKITVFVDYSAANTVHCSGIVNK